MLAHIVLFLIMQDSYTLLPSFFKGSKFYEFYEVLKNVKYTPLTIQSCI